MKTFKVSNVKINTNKLQTQDLSKSFEEFKLSNVEACGCDVNKLCGVNKKTRGDAEGKQHQFLESVLTAFDNHYPLVLSPDTIWLTLAQGFATHVNLNAEALRKHFVKHEGKVTLKVIRDEFIKGSKDNDWTSVFGEFSEQIAGYVGKKRDLVVSDFSTTTVIEKAASEIVLMDAMSSYFKYEVLTRCGIPEITLLGTVEDWKNIRRRAEMFSEFGLEWWTKSLLPVLDEFVKAASGSSNKEFWQSFAKRQSVSGGENVTGWINVLFPYIKDYKDNQIKNKFAENWNNDKGYNAGPGVADFSSGLSKAPFIWNYYRVEYKYEFVAGFVGFGQEEAGLRPTIGWAVKEQ